MTWFFIVTDITGAILCDVATLVQNKVFSMIKLIEQ